MFLPTEPPLVCRSASGSEMREGGQQKAKPWNLEEFVNWRMSLEHARIANRRCLAGSTDVKAISTLKKQNALTNSASPVACAIISGDVVPVGHFPSSLALHRNEKDWTTGGFVELEKEQQVGVKFCLHKIQKLCRAKRR